MEEITLQALLEAGCHFGHKSERWHPKAAQFIYTEKDGIHVIDLAKTKAGLDAAMAFIRELTKTGGEVLFVGTKRQAQGVVKQEVEAVGAPYFVQRWVGGFLTNWDQVRKNIEKINRMTDEQANGGWKKFPKHEQTKLGHYLARLKIYYGGVLVFKNIPEALFVVDIKKEASAVAEAKRRGVPVVAIVDTNADPEGIDYVIPANDDAVGSIQYITHAIAQAYREGKELRQKEVKSDQLNQSGQLTNDKKADKPADANAMPAKPAEQVVEKKKTAKTKKV
ncbi:30S ribosomal protein S2 [Candidatus Gottesmanbacteria bacterium]|nr:30S ribosomal protein S2 [Candidatus Gottesmanbacteria bacterium]